MLDLPARSRDGAETPALAEALAQPVASEFAFEPARVGGGLFKPADLG